MGPRDIKKLVENKDISDEIILDILKEYTADKFDENGQIIPMDTSANNLAAIEDLSMLIGQLRPNVMQEFLEEFTKKHCENCPACQNMKQQ